MEHWLSSVNITTFTMSDNLISFLSNFRYQELRLRKHGLESPGYLSIIQVSKFTYLSWFQITSYTHEPNSVESVSQSANPSIIDLLIHQSISQLISHWVSHLTFHMWLVALFPIILSLAQYFLVTCMNRNTSMLRLWIC